MIHRSRLILLAALLGAFLPLAAAASDLSVTFFGGMNVSNVDGKTEAFAPKSKLGFAAGTALVVPLDARFAIVPELGYTVRGFSWGKSGGTDLQGNPTGTFETFTVTDVFTVSVAGRASMPLVGSLKGHLLLGPTAGFEVGEHFVASGSSARYESDGLRNTDFGILGGAGLDLPAGPGLLGLAVRYVYGISNLSRDPAVEHHTRAVEIVTSYSGRLGH